MQAGRQASLAGGLSVLQGNMWRQLQASLHGAEKSTQQLLRRALTRDGEDFVVKRSRAHAAIRAAAHPQIRATDSAFDGVHVALSVIKNVHGDSLSNASWREFSNGAGSASIAAALLHNFSGRCTDFHKVQGAEQSLPEDWYATERFQVYKDLYKQLRTDGLPEDHLERMTDPSHLRCLPWDRAFDAKIDHSRNSDETAVVFVDASQSREHAGPVWDVDPRMEEAEYSIVARIDANVPVGSYLVTVGRMVTSENFQVCLERG